MGLKEIRLKKNITQEEISRKTGITLRTIGRIEKENNCNLNSAKLIAEALDLTIDEIFIKK